MEVGMSGFEDWVDGLWWDYEYEEIQLELF